MTIKNRYKLIIWIRRTIIIIATIITAEGSNGEQTGKEKHSQRHRSTNLYYIKLK